MCIGIPMQVIEAADGLARCTGRKGEQQVRTALVGEVAPGDWVLVFLDSAVERLDATRAAEIEATLDLVDQALAGGDAQAPAAFALPSAMSADLLQQLTGGARAAAPATREPRDP
ncbi:HypC/HybG/HupF family hydrogenase formation chaperone [Caldimonas thermodepolymerans]|jgi:hydrogenase assembly chaperone HypC/HupF|uniref:Hydrogenase expression/formation protein HypC n=1 Tax=Caldimonas thermodepolymerans TaxID=215580 RepID=A0A2S5T5C9_9BURK|nr:HypC/HybG/HupF family hydrogenase formation chaperone [Caldimonas thermodepolymerans]PPE70077.1 HypC/HybG/HupF family hydrogenase formation chaperone [Caldimonas thermodepolymerans]QPC31823.1 HypC/HybG/HupF family hydrogenase formation chaperone [Caldimonas thermodepolymerans]RDI01671.1 hydrogenase expression/formation protein HypC [Caldimonas thermodepolymerans]TCP05808.1 hydrogenase expression/formation protein HypC [Caldimonas thermodepolymerans]UZG44607.1 HypC/HybG/HupF family hydrogena